MSWLQYSLLVWVLGKLLSLFEADFPKVRITIFIFQTISRINSNNLGKASNSLLDKNRFSQRLVDCYAASLCSRHIPEFRLHWWDWGWGEEQETGLLPDLWLKRPLASQTSSVTWSLMIQSCNTGGKKKSINYTLWWAFQIQTKNGPHEWFLWDVGV